MCLTLDLYCYGNCHPSVVVMGSRPTVHTVQLFLNCACEDLNVSWLLMRSSSDPVMYGKLTCMWRWQADIWILQRYKVFLDFSAGQSRSKSTSVSLGFRSVFIENVWCDSEDNQTRVTSTNFSFERSHNKFIFLIFLPLLSSYLLSMCTYVTFTPSFSPHFSPWGGGGGRLCALSVLIWSLR